MTIKFIFKFCIKFLMSCQHKICFSPRWKHQPPDHHFCLRHCPENTMSQLVSILSILLKKIIFCFTSHHSHIGSCCPCPPLCVSWSPSCNRKSRGVSRWLCAGCLMARWSCSDEEKERKYENVLSDSRL